MNKNIVITILSVLVILLLGVVGYSHYFLKVQGTSNIGDLVADSLTTTTANGGTANLTVAGTATFNGGVVYSGSVSTKNGVTDTTDHTSSLNQASTTACSLESNPTATSTLVGGTALFSLASSTVATTVTIYGGGSTPWTDSTILASSSIASGAQGTVNALATSSPATMTGTSYALAQNNLVFAPATYLNVVLSGGTGTFSPIGACTGIFRSAN